MVEAAAEQKHVLLVEDDGLIREALASHLEALGLDVIQVGNALAAIGVLMQSRQEIDLVFTDLMMPGNMDGVDLTKWVVRYRPGMPVIITSVDTALMDAAKELTGVEAVSKPFIYDLVTQKVRAAIARQAS